MGQGRQGRQGRRELRERRERREQEPTTNNHQPTTINHQLPTHYQSKIPLAPHYILSFFIGNLTLA
ncbi:hypothetical protein [Chroococcidiopsis thermalis]|uniref:hypothetical protein n=1 Tax=Chroococcidiopsis thermalis TaxID=54299 RepID=UPI0002D91622|nr:hypothetical protein [Chroococcidiopsis thermalis]